MTFVKFFNRQQHFAYKLSILSKKYHLILVESKKNITFAQKTKLRHL